MVAVNAVFASRNPDKARELEQLLPGWRVEPLTGGTFPPETGTSYYENARAKAQFGRLIVRRPLWVLGEDSGIEVAALDWGPASSRLASAATTRSAGYSRSFPGSKVKAVAPATSAS
jgi:inosine/xanthosine triphosphate pyrophosphatase family protein